MTLRKIHYAWVVAGATFLTLLLGAGVRSTPGILMVPFEQEFHWSRSTISFAVAVNLVLFGLIGPFAAAMMERFGIRRLMLASITLIGTGVALTTFMRKSWQLILLWGVVVGTGTGTAANVLAATVATRWFTKNRGLVVGILSSAAAAGQLIFLPTMASIVTAYGWRPMVLAIVCVAIAIFPIVAIFMRDRPEDVGLAPYGESVVAREAAARRRQSGRDRDSARWAKACVGATSGSSPAASSSAAPRPMGSSRRISFRRASTTAYRK